MLKKISVAVFLIVFSLLAIAQPDGYKKLYTIKQPYHTFNSTKYQETKKAYQKVNGIKITDNEKILIISYSYNPTTVVMYEIGTWKEIALFKVTGPGVDLYTSYYDDKAKVLYIKYDRYSTKYKALEVETNYTKKVPCRKTPKGCYYVEVRQEDKEATTRNKKFYFEVSKFDASDVEVYIKSVDR